MANSVDDAAATERERLLATELAARNDAAERALAEARRRSDSALLAGNVGTYDWDIANDRVFGDENFARLFGLKLDGAGTAPIAKYLAAIHVDDLPETQRRIEHTLQTGAPFESEYRITTGGRDRWVIARGRIERDNAGRPVRFPGVVVDITERRRAEAALRVSEERYRTLFNSIDQGFCVIEVLNDESGNPFDYRFDEVNPAFERQSGLVSAAGQSMREMVPDFDRYFPELYGRVARTGEPIRAENEVPAMGRWFDVNAFRVGSPADPRVAVLFSDVTVQRKALNALRESEARFRQLADAMPQIVWAAEPDGTVDYYNRRWYEYTGMPADPIGRASWEGVLHPGDVERLAAAWEEAVRSGKTFDTEQLYRRASDKTFRWHLVRAEPVRDADGRIVRWFGTSTDVHDQKMAAHAMHATATRLESALSVASLGTFEWDVISNRVRLDDRSREIFGFAPGEGTTAGEMFGRIDSSDFERVFSLAQAAARDASDLEIEYRLRLPGGSIRTIVSSGGCAVGSDGRTERMFGVFRDVTERRREAQRREELLRAVEAERANLTAVVEQSPAFMCVLRGPQHTFELANERYYDLIGRRGILGKSVRDALPEIEGQGFFELLDAVYQTGEPSGGNEVPVTIRFGSDGRLKHARLSFVYQALRGADGKVSGVFVHGVDVTDSVHAREAVQFSERQRRLALDSAELGEWHIDAATRVLTCDERFRDIFGISGDEAIYEKAFAAIHPEDRERVRHAVEASMRPDNPVPYADEHRVILPDGSVRWVFGKGRANYVGEGSDCRLISLDGTIADITDRKRLETERQELLDSERVARAEAELAGRMKDEFLATLSHELRTPLNAIVGWTQILRSSSDSDPEDLAQGLEVIDRNARAQTQIIEDILDMSRIISGKLRLDVQRVDLAALVQAGVSTVQTTADAKGVRLQVMLDPAAGPTSGDPNRLHQIFWNLLSNAVKFTPKNGRVQVSLERVNSHVEVSVADTGEGIEPDFLPYVFDRFRQADASTTRKHGGLGLGLAIVKQLVEMHGGRVSVRSMGAGRGSTFIVALPLTIANLHSQPEALPREHPKTDVPFDLHQLACQQLAGVDVLAVDDEPDASSMIKRLLEDCGAVVRTANSATEAIALFEARAPMVLISDIGMPGEDGYSLIRQVRALPIAEGGRVHALALTAYARAADRIKALEAGFQMHLSKPVEPIELVVTVSSLAKQAMGNV